MLSIYYHILINTFSTKSKENSQSPLKSAEIFYDDPISQLNIIRIDNNGKIGIYAWENKTNNKLYIGGVDPLYLRLCGYYQPWYLNSRDNLYIVRSLNKYTMASFNLYILEYTNSQDLISCEQKWINMLYPKYNINPLAGNSKGYKHTQESFDKMRQLALDR